MSMVSQEMILEYMRKKGGRVKNVDLVKHFRKHLLFDDKQKKEQARELFKETVNSVAVIRQEEGDKFLYLKDEHSLGYDIQRASQSPPPQTPNRTSQPPSPQPRPPSPSRVPPQPLKPVQTLSNQRISQSSNLGKPTDLSNGRPLSIEVSKNSTQQQNSPNTVSGVTPPRRMPPGPPDVSSRPSNVRYQSNGSRPDVSHQYHNGLTDLQLPEEKSLSPKRKSPVPPPKPSDRSSPQGSVGVSQSNRGVSPSGRGVSPSPQTKEPPNVSSGRSNSPRVMSPPRSVNKRTNGEGVVSPSHSSADPRHRPVSGTISLPYSQTPPTSHSHRQSKLVSQATMPTLTPPQSSLGGRGNNSKRRIEISGPVHVTTLSNGHPMSNPSPLAYGSAPQNIPSIFSSNSDSFDDKLLFERYTSELENIGSSSSMTPSHSLEASSLRSSSGDFLGNPSTHFIPSSENSSLSSTSVHSTSPIDLNSAPNQLKQGQKPSQAGIGVQKLIQQYTVPPGAIAVATPTDHALLSPTRTAKVGRSSSSINSQNGGNVVMRRQHTPPDARVQRSHSNVNRKSRLLERNSTLDTLTRQSIKGTHKLSHRLSKNSDELITTASKEELLSNEDHDRDSPIMDEYVFDIEPMEKEWMLALIDSNMDEIHRILMVDNTFINKKGFLHGWTALHWAVKEGREEIIRSLILSGANVDIKSGLTPLHIAAETGNEDTIRLLVYEYSASTNARDHSGKRPIDMLHPFSRETLKTTLRNGLKHGPGFKNASLAIAMGTSTPGAANSFHMNTPAGSTLRRNWNSTGHLMENQAVDKATIRRNQMSPRVAKKGFSFRGKKKYQVNSRDKRDSSSSEYYHEKRDS